MRQPVAHSGHLLPSIRSLRNVAQGEAHPMTEVRINVSNALLRRPRAGLSLPVSLLDSSSPGWVSRLKVDNLGWVVSSLKIDTGGERWVSDPRLKQAWMWETGWELIPFWTSLFTRFCTVLHFQESPLPPGFRRGWARTVRKVRMLRNVDILDVSDRLCPTYGDLLGVLDSSEREITVISHRNGQKYTVKCPPLCR